MAGTLAGIVDGAEKLAELPREDILIALAGFVRQNQRGDFDIIAMIAAAIIAMIAAATFVLAAAQVRIIEEPNECNGFQVVDQYGNLI